MTRLPSIAITPGEPSGIGPDILLQLALKPIPAILVAFADPNLLAQRATQLGLSIQLHNHSLSKRKGNQKEKSPPTPLYESGEFPPLKKGGRGDLFFPSLKPKALTPHQPGHLNVIPIPLAQPVKSGQLNPANAGYVLETLRQACEACTNNDFDALVTGPVQKSVINEAGIPFSGHTEFLAEQTGVKQVVMMLATPNLRVALVTTHLPLSQVSAAITPARLENTIRILQVDLQTKLGITVPHILVCGLNPHAGEGGHLGPEEIQTIIPTLNKLRSEGMHLTGPVSADTAFTPTSLSGVDVVLSMYHDQGLPVLKQVGFGQSVNLTLGLPIIRTSVDHGTALELAGTGTASSDSLYHAILMARDMINIYSNPK